MEIISILIYQCITIFESYEIMLLRDIYHELDGPTTINHATTSIFFMAFRNSLNLTIITSVFVERKHIMAT